MWLRRRDAGNGFQWLLWGKNNEMKWESVWVCCKEIPYWSFEGLWIYLRTKVPYDCAVLIHGRNTIVHCIEMTVKQGLISATAVVKKDANHEMSGTGGVAWCRPLFWRKEYVESPWTRRLSCFCTVPLLMISSAACAHKPERFIAYDSPIPAPSENDHGHFQDRLEIFNVKWWSSTNIAIIRSWLWRYPGAPICVLVSTAARSHFTARLDICV